MAVLEAAPNNWDLPHSWPRTPPRSVPNHPNAELSQDLFRRLPPHTHGIYHCNT